MYCALCPRVLKYFSNPLGHPLFNAQYMRFSCCGYTCSERCVFLTCHALKRGRPERLLTQFLLKFARCAHFNTNVHPQTHGNTHNLGRFLLPWPDSFFNETVVGVAQNTHCVSCNLRHVLSIAELYKVFFWFRFPLLGDSRLESPSQPAIT